MPNQLRQPKNQVRQPKHQVRQPKHQVRQSKHQVRQTKHQVRQPKHQLCNLNQKSMIKQVLIYAVLLRIYALFWRTFFSPKKYGGVPKMTIIRYVPELKYVGKKSNLTMQLKTLIMIGRHICLSN